MKDRFIHDKDPNAHCLRNLLVIPLSNIVGYVAQKHETKAIQDTFDEVRNLRTDSNGFNAALAASLPSCPDGIPQSMKLMIENALTDGADELDKLTAEIKAKRRRKELNELCPYLSK